MTPEALETLKQLGGSPLASLITLRIQASSWGWRCLSDLSPRGRAIERDRDRERDRERYETEREREREREKARERE